MKESFQSPETPTEPDETQLTVQTPGPLAAQGLEGEFDLTDLQIPRFNLVAKNSNLISKTVPAGAFLYNKEQVLSDGKQPLRVVVLNIRKEYWQKLPQGSQERPLVFTKIHDVREAGGTLDRNTADEIPFQSCARLTILIESAEARDGFIFEADGKFYAPAVWFLSSTAYTAVAKKMLTDSQLSLKKEGIMSRLYEVTAKIESNAKGSWYMPQARLTADKTPETLLSQVKDLFK